MSISTIVFLTWLVGASVTLGSFSHRLELEPDYGWRLEVFVVSASVFWILVLAASFIGAVSAEIDR